MNQRLLLGSLTTALLLSSACAPRRTVPTNIILFIGDGMGVSQITAAKTVKGSLHIEKFQQVSLVTTNSANRYVTDSAAAGTAIATGNKTNNGMVAVSPDTLTCKTVLEHAEEAGLSTGLVVTSEVTNATPATFSSHVASRGNQTEIARQIALSGVDVLFGGGLGYFLPQSADSSLRHDDENLLGLFDKEYTVISTAAGLDSLTDSSKAIGLFYRSSPPPIHNRSYSLAELTAKAIDILSRNSSGFFLMVEGSQIDWEGHSNNSDGIIAELIDFDDAVGVGYDFAVTNGNTLIIVTADHETGGYTVNNGSIADKKITDGRFTTTWHTGTMVPFFCCGPGSDSFQGIFDNTKIGTTLIDFVTKR